MADDFTTQLPAYLDGELNARDMGAMDAHLKMCAVCAAEVLHQVQMKRAVRLAGKRYTTDPAFRARIRQQVAPRQASAWRAWLVAATATAMLLVGSLAAIYLGQRQSNRAHIFGEIADLHVAGLASANPVDVVSSDRHTVKPWFAGKLPFTFALPELDNSGFSLLGGRVTYLNQTPGAHLIYQIRKHQVSVLIFQERSMAAALGSDAGARRRRSFQVESWNQDGLRYFVIGDASPEDIRSLANLLKAAEGA